MRKPLREEEEHVSFERVFVTSQTADNVYNVSPQPLSLRMERASAFQIYIYANASHILAIFHVPQRGKTGKRFLVDVVGRTKHLHTLE